MDPPAYHPTALRLRLLSGRYAVCRLAPDVRVPEWALDGGPLVAVTRTADELSIVCDEGAAPPDVRAERGFIGLAVVGPLDFDVVGVLAALTATLARDRIPLLAISTFDTDYLLIREHHLERALLALRQAGHIVMV